MFNSNDIESKHIFISLTITFVNIKMFIFQPLLLKNKIFLTHTILRPFLSQLYNYIIAITKTSNSHRLESAGLNALEDLLRCWECTEKIVKPACVF